LWEVQTFHASLKNAQDIWRLWDFNAVHDLPIRIHQIRMEKHVLGQKYFLLKQITIDYFLISKQIAI
jgi:hypothetical protein